jgi:hypothetical protein
MPSFYHEGGVSSTSTPSSSIPSFLRQPSPSSNVSALPSFLQPQALRSPPDSYSDLQHPLYPRVQLQPAAASHHSSSSLQRIPAASPASFQEQSSFQPFLQVFQFVELKKLSFKNFLICLLKKIVCIAFGTGIGTFELFYFPNEL